MKLLLITINFCVIYFQVIAQSDKNILYSDVTVTVNDPDESEYPRLAIIRNGLVVNFYINQNDRISKINNALFNEQSKDLKDQIEFYGQNLKIHLLVKPTSPFSIFAKKLIYDNIVFDNDNVTPWKISDLEYQIDSNNTSDYGWKGVNTLPKDSNSYILLDNKSSGALKIDTKITITFRYKNTQEIFRVFEIVRKSLKPQKLLEIHDSTGNQSFERILLSKDSLQKKVDSIYELQLKTDTPELNSSSFYKQESRLLWFFARVDKDLPDSSLRFSLQANGKDWVVREGITGHLLLLDNLYAGNDYTLKIWYVLQPENFETFQINLPSYWYNKPAIQVAFIFSILTLIFLLGKSILKKQNRKSTLRLQQAQNAFASVRAQLNPHFVFNELNSIQALMNSGKIDGANDYMSRFSKLLRTSLQPNYQGMVPLNVELELLQQYIELEQLRMPFTYTTQIQPSLDIHAIEIPGMLLQPIAENAIKHGLPGATEPKLTCEVAADHENLSIAIKNNGYPLKEFHQNGLGLKIVEEKLQILNKCFPGTNAAYQLSTSNNLTTVTINLHQWMK
jgi:hypothetical protein